MAANKPAPTAIDHVTVVLSPALIMGLVGSLVLFLLEVLYKADGPWRERLTWILFFYVFGVVLTARIALNAEIAHRAGLYSSVLALLTYVGMQSFVEYPPGVRELSFVANLFLVAVVWWVTNRLVRDCTNVDEDVDSSSEGLLQAAGIDEPVTDPVPEVNEKGEPLGWLDRWRLYSERQRKGRTLGVWVVYFSLAALPIFGLGQALIPLSSPERRRYAFWLMTVYLACGVGLLLTTCFLGLRRYLRQRRLQMPAAMTGTWLATGGLLLAALIGIAAVLPRPYSENAVFSGWMQQAGSKKRDASQFAAKGDSATQGKGRPGEAKPDGKGEPGNKGGKDGDPGKDGKDGKGGDGKDGKGGEKKDGKGGEQKDGKDSGPKGEKKDAPGKNEQQKGEPGKSDPGKGGQSASPPPLAKLHDLLQTSAPWVKWLVFAIIGVIVVLALVRALVGFFANFSDWAKRWLEWWNGLFGQKPAGAAADDDDEVIEADPEAPFRAFANPFDSGAADRMSPRQLVRYTFAALEAWARERDLGRRDDETPTEFIDRLANEVPGIEKEGRRLVRLYVQAEYGAGEPPAGVGPTLQAFWDRLERVADAPMSA